MLRFGWRAATGRTGFGFVAGEAGTVGTLEDFDGLTAVLELGGSGEPVIVPDLWSVDSRPGAGRFTTIASWGGYGDVCYRGEWYGSKYIEFGRFAELPKIPERLELDRAISRSKLLGRPDHFGHIDRSIHRRFEDWRFRPRDRRNPLCGR